MKDEYWMQMALDLARKAEAAGEVPVGAVLVKDDQLIAEGWNQPIISHDSTLTPRSWRCVKPVKNSITID